MLGHLFNRQHRSTNHSTVTAFQGCLRCPHYWSLSLQSCPDRSPWCPYMILSFLTTFQYMMTGIHMDVQLYDNVCIFLKEGGRREVFEIFPTVWFCCCCCAWKYLRCFAPVEEAVVEKCQLVLGLIRKNLRGGQIDSPLNLLRVKIILSSRWNFCVCNGVVFQLNLLTGNQKIPPRESGRGYVASESLLRQ